MPPFIQQFIDRFGRGRSVALVVVGVLAVLAIWAFAHWATAPSWVAVYPGMPLEMVGEVTARLDEARIEYRLEKGGSEVQVAESDLARARVLLAQQGLPSRSRPGFELFDQPAWGMTDFTQRVNYRRALEGELERTIGQMRGVEAAQVHLALHETSVFRREQKPAEASVFLKLRPGVRASSELVEGVTFLVASSVDGLSGQNVTVLDDTGRVLSAAAEPGVPDVLTKRQLDFQRELEGHLERKAEELVARVVGAGNVQVRVSAAVSFDRVEKMIQSVDPDAQVVMQEQRSEVVPGADSQAAGSTVENTTYDVTRQVETYSGAVGGLKRLTVAVLVNEKAVGAGGEERTEPWTAEELRRVEALVRTAVGIDETRGDEISVVSVPFTTAPAVAVPDAEDGPGILGVAQTLQRPLIGLLAVVLAFVLAMQVVKSLPRVQPAPARAAAVAGGGSAMLEEQEEDLRLPAQPNLAERRIDGRDHITATLARRPDNAARVVRAWLKD